MGIAEDSSSSEFDELSGSDSNEEDYTFFYKKPGYKKLSPSRAKSEKNKELIGLKSSVLRNFLPYNVLDFLIFSTFPGKWRKIGEK